MAFSVPVVAAIAGLLALLYNYILYPTFLSPLSKIPAANFTAHFCPLWKHYIRYTRQDNESTYQLHKKLGPIVRMGPNELSVNCYEDGLKTIYAGSFAKHQFYERFACYNIPPMFVMQDGKMHATRRRMVSQVFSKSYILSSSVLQATTKRVLHERLLPRIETASSTKTSLEWVTLSFGYVMDAYLAFQFGFSIGSNFIENDSQCKWFVSSFHAQDAFSYWIENHPRLRCWMSLIGIPLVPDRVGRSYSELEEWVLDLCDKAQALLNANTPIPTENYPTVFAQLFLAMEKWGGPTLSSSAQPYPYRMDIAADMFDFSVAAIDTSGVTLSYICYELSRHPKLQTRLREELLTLSPSLLHDPTNPETFQLPGPRAIDALPLLDAVLQETFRLWPASAGGQPRVTPSPSCSLAGYDNIPPGIRVQSATSTLHRNASIFPEPEIWIPERWLNASPEKLTEMRHWFWAFGSGSRMCIGSHFAVQSLKTVIAALYTNYTSTIAEASDMRMTDGFLGAPRDGKLILQWTRV